MKIGSRLIVLLLAQLISACATDDIDTRRETLRDATLLVARPSSRLITERLRLVGDQATQVLCSEPSPDVAIALAGSANVSGSGSAPGGPTASLSGSFASSETASLLAGRTAGVVALRDGLYVACQAYVNGVIGHSSYGIILSQYGRLLKELVGSNPSGTGADKGGASSASAAPGALVLTVAGGSITSPATSNGRSSSPTPSTDAAQSPPASSARDDLLLVACITEFDPTRITPVDPTTKIPIRNELLALNCRSFLKRISAAPSQTSDASTAPGRGRARRP